MAGALAGIKIVDLTAVILGPYAMQLLGDQGADIVKIEPPEGEMLRHLGVSRHNRGMGPAHLAINRNKRSLALDLKQPASRAALLKVIEGADALVHTMRPQAIAALGLDYDAVRQVNPEIVYAGAYGYGADGPYGDRPAYDDVIQGLCGVAALNGAQDGVPKYAPTIIADKTVGLTLAYAVLAGLIHKLRSGKGQKIEVPMFETMVQFVMVEHLNRRTFDPEHGKAGYERMLAKSRKPYRTKDGWICILPYTDRHWTRFFEMAGRADLAADPRFSDVTQRSANIAALYDELEQIAPSRGTAEWLALLRQAQIPCGAINTLDDLFDDEHLRAVGMFATVEHPSEGTIAAVRPPASFSATPGELRLGAPLIGQHSLEILREAGVAAEQIDALVTSGAVIQAKESS
ncbi:MAG: CoA transferase [Rhodospirillales bacterium]